MLFRQLEYFAALARERHFAKAAAACYVSQPALSESIRKLEHELGVPLVNRGHVFEGLTPEGERLVAWARRILADQDALKQEVAAMRSGLSGTLRISVIPAASTIASLLLEPFCAAHPLVSVALETRLPSVEILARLDRFELDVGIINTERVGLSRRPSTYLYEEQMVLAASRELIPESIEQIGWPELSQFPICALSETMYERRLIDEQVSSRGLVLRPDIETDSIASMYSLAASGRWASIVPNAWFHPFPSALEVRLIPLVDPIVATDVVLAAGRNEPSSMLGDAFAEFAGRMALDQLLGVTTSQRLTEHSA